MRSVPLPATAAPGPESGPAESAPRADDAGEEVRIGVLVRTIEHEIIPRLMLAHRLEPACLQIPEGRGGIGLEDIEMFVKLALSPDEELASACVTSMRTRGVSAEDICLGLLAPVARRLGEMWEQDLCDFTDVTFGLGRLQQILRNLGPDFMQAPDAPANGYRVLLLPAPHEQHTFGLVMVGEFFRHEGWDVEMALAEGGSDPVAAVKSEWFDVVGFSLGSLAHLDALRECIARVRQSSTNKSLCIMVGGSLVRHGSEQADRLGVDAATADGRAAPLIAERLVASRGGRTRQ